jgi:hypothetical protein
MSATRLRGRRTVRDREFIIWVSSRSEFDRLTSCQIRRQRLRRVFVLAIVEKMDMISRRFGVHSLESWAKVCRSFFYSWGSDDGGGRCQEEEEIRTHFGLSY